MHSAWGHQIFIKTLARVFLFCLEINWGYIYLVYLLKLLLFLSKLNYLVETLLRMIYDYYKLRRKI